MIERTIRKDPKLDQIISEKVMLNPKHTWVDGCGQPGILSTYEGCSWCERERLPEREAEVCLKPYSSDSECAMEVIETMGCVGGYQVKMRTMMGQSISNWQVAFFRPGQFNEKLLAEAVDWESSFPRTFARAVCLAALRALGIPYD